MSANLPGNIIGSLYIGRYDDCIFRADYHKDKPEEIWLVSVNGKQSMRRIDIETLNANYILAGLEGFDIVLPNGTVMKLIDFNYRSTVTLKYEYRKEIKCYSPEQFSAMYKKLESEPILNSQADFHACANGPSPSISLPEKCNATYCSSYRKDDRNCSNNCSLHGNIKDCVSNAKKDTTKCDVCIDDYAITCVGQTVFRIADCSPGCATIKLCRVDEFGSFNVTLKQLKENYVVVRTGMAVVTDDISRNFRIESIDRDVAYVWLIKISNYNKKYQAVLTGKSMITAMQEQGYDFYGKVEKVFMSIDRVEPTEPYLTCNPGDLFIGKYSLYLYKVIRTYPDECKIVIENFKTDYLETIPFETLQADYICIGRIGREVNESSYCYGFQIDGVDKVLLGGKESTWEFRVSTINHTVRQTATLSIKEMKKALEANEYQWKIKNAESKHTDTEDALMYRNFMDSKEDPKQYLSNLYKESTKSLTAKEFVQQPMIDTGTFNLIQSSYTPIYEESAWTQPKDRRTISKYGDIYRNSLYEPTTLTTTTPRTQNLLITTGGSQLKHIENTRSINILYGGYDLK